MVRLHDLRNAALAAFGYPLFVVLSSGEVASALVAALLFVVLAGGFIGTSNTTAIEHFPTRTRFSGFALGCNLGAAVFGGTTPLLAAWVICETGNLTAASVYLILAALGTMVVCWRLKETYRADVD